MNIVYFSLTRQGSCLARKLNDVLPGEIVTKESLLSENIRFSEKVCSVWDNAQGLVFIMASGIVVRTVAPLLKSKTCDPAIVVMDGEGKFAVSLLSGHLGGANDLAKRLSEICGAQAVITTGTDVANTLAFDLFATQYGFRIENIDKLKYISSAMIEKEPLLVFSSWGDCPDFPDNILLYTKDGRPSCLASDSILKKSAMVFLGHEYDESVFYGNTLWDNGLPLLKLRPRNLYVGVGCKKNTDPQLLEEAFKDFLQRYHICKDDIAGIATIGLKKDEPAIQSLCHSCGLSLTVMDVNEILPLESLYKLEGSSFVRSVAKVASVCEGSALAAAWQSVPHPEQSKVRLICRKTKYEGITLALAERTPWIQSEKKGS